MPGDMRAAVLGVDVGTSALKAGLFGLDGTPLGFGRASYAMSAPEDQAMEQDPEDWWNALASVSRKLLASASADLRVAALAIGGQGPTLVATDADFVPTHPAITWLDQRPSEEVERLYASLGQPVPVWGSWPAQAAWLVKHRPAVMARTRWLLGCPDYLVSRLTRTPTALIDNDLGEIQTAGLDTRMLPPPWTPGEMVGRIDDAGAAATGLSVGIPVVGGMVDGLMGVLGSGVRRAGDGCINGGTSGTYSAVCTPPLGYSMLGLQIAGSATNTSGKALDWFAERIAGGTASHTELVALAAQAPPGSDGLLFLPHLAGERAPEPDPSARGAWVGLTLEHDRRHLVRALLEGVAFSFRGLQDWLEGQGAAVREVRSVGAQARSDTWNQIKADVLNRPILVPEEVEATVLGAAILASLGIGEYPDMESASAAMVRVSRRLEPDPENAALYEALLDTYRGLYPALRATNRRLHDLSASLRR